MTTATIANVLGAFAQAITDSVQQEIDAGAGETPGGAAALVHLSKYRDESIDALRRPLGLSHPGCVRLVDRLEERRLVVRGAAEDRRARSLRLTPKGETAAREVLRKRRGALRRALETLSPREQRLLGDLAGKVLGSLVEDEAHALEVCRVCDYRDCPDAVCPVAKALTA